MTRAATQAQRAVCDLAFTRTRCAARRASSLVLEWANVPHVVVLGTRFSWSARVMRSWRALVAKVAISG